MITTGETPLATTGAAAEVAIAKNDTLMQHAQITNDGTFAGFISLDGGISFARLSKSGTQNFDGLSIVNQDILIKREGANDLAGIFIAVW